MKTIMHITEVLSGGVLPVISGICNGLCEKYRFVVVYGLRFDTPRNLDEIFDARVKLIPIPALQLKMSLTGDLKAIRDIRKCVKNEKPDVIHIHSTKAGIDARVGLIGIKIPKYYTPHGFCFLRKDQNGIKHIVLLTMEKILALMCNGIISCGKNEYYEAKKISSNAILVENGIDTDLIDEIIRDEEVSSHVYTIYTAGRIGPQKNAKMFNEIAGRMPEKRFVWIGDGDDRCLLTSPNIEVTGIIPRKDVIRRSVNYDCYLSTSLWEGLPIALMEAMYLKKKCVVSDVEGNNELVIQGCTGALFKDVIQACTLVESNDEYGLEARKFILDNYSLEVMCQKYSEVYQ